MTRAIVVGAAIGFAGLGLLAQTHQVRTPKPNVTTSTPGKPIKVLVVGLSPVQANSYPQLASPLARRGIQLTCLTNGEAATADRLAFYDLVMLPGKENERTTEQENVIRAFKGPVFHAAADGDAATWATPAFHARIEEGIVAAVTEPVRTAWKQLKMAETVYVDGLPIPNYENRDPVPRYQLPLSVQESMKYIQVPAEFSVELFASEPDIVKPISFNFDERGRLWLIETVDYPNKILNGQPGDDRIKILEDTDGDGRADKFTVFADRLNIPTSLTFANGGVIVSQAPHILFLKDTNGDDKADVRDILSTGWGTTDTHAGPSNLQYGPDNYVWGSVGYSGFKGTMNGKPMQFSQGLYRFRPDGRDFEFVTASTNNTWGLGFTETFDVFGSTANNEPSFYAAIPNRYFDGVEGLPASRAGGPGYQSIAAFYSVHPLTPYIRQVDVHGGYTAAAGHHIYTARSFPKEYWNRIAFISEPTAHLVGQGILEKQGAGFVTRDGWNLFAGSEEWVAPIHAQVGPDGALWISDWYNFITQHNPTPPGFSNGPGNAFETSLRDRQRGRIYRVAYRNAPPAKRRSLSRNDPAGLIEALSADNMFWRLQAQRLIVERGGTDLIRQLETLARNKSVDVIGINGAAFHALWALKGLGALVPQSSAYAAAMLGLEHPAAGVRKAALMILPRDAVTAETLVAKNLLRDPDLHTRLAAVLAAAEMPQSKDLGAALYKESQNPENFRDRWLSRAFYIAATHHKSAFLSLYRADPNALSVGDLPVPLRLGATKPDWRVPAAEELGAWGEMEVPGNWETRGLPDFDGVVWFTRTFEWPQGANSSGLTLGRVNNTSEIWINGLPSTPQPAGGRGAAPAAGGRGFIPPTYDVTPGTLRAQNTITVRIQNTRGDGGFMGPPDSMYIQAGEKRIPLAGTWKYRVERQTNAGALYSKPGELAAHLAYTESGGSASPQAPPAATQAPDVTLKLGVVPAQLKFDLEELTVAPGQLVEIVFVNSDQMQHNFLLGAAGSLEEIGKAADALAASPNAAAQQYVPDIPQVLYSTKLIDPGQTLKFQFKAPAQPGQYPYVCTFPGHWRLMNGTLRVVAPAPRGGGL